MRAAVDRRVKSEANGFRVVPVFLPGASCSEELPAFLRSSSGVEFRNALASKNVLDFFEKWCTGLLHTVTFRLTPPTQRNKGLQNEKHWVRTNPFGGALPLHAWLGSSRADIYTCQKSDLTDQGPDTRTA